MSDDTKRHFMAREEADYVLEFEVTGEFDEIDLIITSAHSAKTVRPRTEKGRAFLAERHIHPASYTDQPIELQPGSLDMLKAALRERGLRAKYDYTGNHREVE
jgi:hypothetical protein